MVWENKGHYGWEAWGWGGMVDWWRRSRAGGSVSDIKSLWCCLFTLLWTSKQRAGQHSQSGPFFSDSLSPVISLSPKLRQSPKQRHLLGLKTLSLWGRIHILTIIGTTFFAVFQKDGDILTICSLVRAAQMVTPQSASGLPGDETLQELNC